MGRKYNSQYYRDLVLDITAQIPGAAVTTDVMVGFPGETEENFNDTFKLLDELPIYNMHVFKYSRRAGTPAAEMAGQVNEAVKQQRSARLLGMAEQKRIAFVESQKDKILTILVERMTKNGMLCGITDNYINVQFNSQYVKPGQFASIKITSCDDNPRGEIVDHK
jgi:threonylcarbamoyladenosine tRNA methylthiotransferase MtaB